MADDPANNPLADNPAFTLIKGRADLVVKYESLVDEQLKKLGGVASFDQTTVTRDAAVLAALSARALTERQHLLAAEQNVFANAMIQSMTAAATALNRTNTSTQRLARWTMCLAIATLLLMLATAGLVVVEWLKPEPHIVIQQSPAPSPTVVTPPR